MNNNDDGHVSLINKTGLFYSGPVLLDGCFVSGDGAAAEVDIYDGTNDKGEHKFRINVGSDSSIPIVLLKPSYFQFGIYIVVNAATTFVSVQFEPVNVGYKH